MTDMPITNKQKFVDYVRHGAPRLLCSPQIGAGAGYDAKLMGKRFCSESTLEDTVSVCRRYPMVPLYNVGLDPVSHAGMRWVADEHARTEERIEGKSHLDTPYGTMRRHTIEHPQLGGFSVVAPVNGPEDLDMLEYVIDRALAETDDSCYTELGERYAKFFGEEGALSVQWGMQPYELFSYPSTMTTALLALDEEKRFFRMMDKILTIDMRILDALAGTGVDFVFLGGPAAEMISPKYYEKFLVPYSRIVTDYAHEKGFLIYSHVCSPIEPMLTNGYFNQMGIDLFETLSPRPEGNIKSIEDAFDKLDIGMCTRGNVSLALMVTGKPGQVRDEVFHIMDAAHARNRKHIVAVSDYLLYHVPEENVVALCEAARDYYR